MERLQKAAILTELADQLRREGSWCGHTHMQKATYFLQELLGVPTGYEFILYKHGPYSFELSEEMTGIRADYLIEFDHKSPSYGPGLAPTRTSAELRSRIPCHPVETRPRDRVRRAHSVAKGVTELEKLATGIHVTREDASANGVEERSRRTRRVETSCSARPGSLMQFASLTGSPRKPQHVERRRCPQTVSEAIPTLGNSQGISQETDCLVGEVRQAIIEMIEVRGDILLIVGNSESAE